MARILVIDDDGGIRSMLRRLLEEEGYEVMEAPDGKVGIRLFRENRIDLIITDIIMPEKEGVETIMEIKRDFPEAAVIAMSGGGTRMTGDSCLALAKTSGAHYAFPKPLDSKALLQAVGQLIEHRPVSD